MKEKLVYYCHILLFFRYKYLVYLICYMLMLYLLNEHSIVWMTDEKSNLPDLTEIDLNPLFAQELSSTRKTIDLLRLENLNLRLENAELNRLVNCYRDQQETFINEIRYLQPQLDEVATLRAQNQGLRRMSRDLLLEIEALKKTSK